MSTIRIGLAQINATVGDFSDNARLIVEHVAQAHDQGVDIVAFPELAVCGYPPEDLLLKPAFSVQNRETLGSIARAIADGPPALIGFADRDVDLYNAAAIVNRGAVAGVYRKQRLPNYGVFDEMRYFRPGRGELLLRSGSALIGVTVCEDMWLPGGPAARLARAGADVIVNINASPFHVGKWRERHSMLSTRASDLGVAIAYVNMVGGQDELVFDGGSFVVAADGRLLAEAEPFVEALLVVDIELEHVFRARLHDPRRRAIAVDAVPTVQVVDLAADGAPRAALTPPTAERVPLVEHDELAETYAALVLGTRDYVRKNGFEHVVLGLSGGLDSSLVAVIAVDALGASAVTGVTLPSRYSSDGSRTDARALADALEIPLLQLPIETMFAAALETLEDPFTGCEPDVAEENLQARIRGMLLMALSNKFGWLLLTTGNKSELATGYATLYGDMAGGFAVIKDVPKTLAYSLARWRNERATAPVIPQSVIDKPPSAELRPDQRDEDSLPAYDVLDPILERYVERDWNLAELVAAGFDESTVRRVMRLVDRAEYKRRQAAPGIKITPRAFGKDRRLPITSKYGLDDQIG